MRCRPLGQTGLWLSEIGLGVHTFPAGDGAWYEGHYGKRIRTDVSEAERRAILEAALAGGINLVAGEGGADLAFETRLTGRLLKAMGARKQVHLVAASDFRPGAYAEARWADLDRHVEALLRDLETEVLDILEVRIAPALVESPFFREFAREAGRLKAAGVIRATAAYTGDDPDDAILGAIASGAFDAVCRPLGFLNPAAARRVLPAAREAGLGFIAFVPFQKGWLFACAREVGLMEDGGAAVARAALRWALGHPGVSSVLVGVSSPRELDADAGATDTGSLAAEERELLWRLVQTRCYAGYLERVRAANPHAVVDWRQAGGPKAL